MNSPLSFVVLVLLTSLNLAQSAEKPSARMHEVRIGARTLCVPAGFEIELVAGPPVISRPICADFDHEGRLHVGEAAGTSNLIQEHIKNRPHRVVRLEDITGAGRFDRRTVFAEGLMIPQGVLWFRGSLYVGAPPSIWKLTDTRGSGVADQRVEWFRGKATGGCANDVRGPYLGRDGWFYWCKGGTEKRTYDRPGQAPFVTSANHVFRSRPDGSGFEPVITGGMDNPVEVAFSRGGERFFTTTQFQRPGTPRTDGLFHAVYGGVYPKDIAPIYEHRWSGPALLPVLASWGASAPAGLTCYESTALGADYRDSLFVAHFNFHKVTRHVLTPSGATFQSREEDFVCSPDIDFHPTDVLEDADGSLLVIDTGGWYRFCCPSSSLFKPDVLGGIYRVRRTGMPKVDDPWGRKLAWQELSPRALCRLLGDERPAMRRHAIERLGEKGPEAVPALRETMRSAESPEARRNAVWAATRIDHPEARAAVRAALTDRDELVRQAALHSIAVHRDAEALAAVVKLLGSSSPHNRRAAAEALGRMGKGEAVSHLLKALETPADRMLEHSLTFALIEIADREATVAGIHSPNPNVRRAALTALDQMKNGRLAVTSVVPELDSTYARLRETAWWIAGRHPEWGEALTASLKKWLRDIDQRPAERGELQQKLAQFAGNPSLRDWLGEQVANTTLSRDARQVVLGAFANAGIKPTPAAWVAGLTQIASSADDELRGDALATARTLPIAAQGNDAFAAALLRLANDTGKDATLRLQALAAVPGGLSQLKSDALALLLPQLKPERPVAQRSLATDVLCRAKLTDEQLCMLAGCFKGVGPLELGRLLDAFQCSRDEKVGRTLVASLLTASARSSLRVESLRPRLAHFGPAVQKEAEQLYAVLDREKANQRDTLEKLLIALKAKPADVRRGQAVFFSAKASCSACHRIAYVGGHVGPALTEIGRLRTERDLLESIVFPSATLVQGYEGVVITTKDGKTVAGIIVKNAPEALVLATGPNQEVRVARQDIEEMHPNRVSIMPAGLDQQLSVQELADLLAFLKACR
jgi:putative membrane-bound dehydrogenase-like protein